MTVRKIDSLHASRLKKSIQAIERFIADEWQFYARGHVYLDRVVVAHVSKGLIVAASVLCLVEGEFPEEAFGLTRTLVEIALNLRYITNSRSEQRAKRFVHYLAKWKLELIKRHRKHYFVTDSEVNKKPNFTKAELAAMTRDYARLVRDARKFPKGTSWTFTGSRASRAGVYMMAQEPDKHELMHGLPLKWEFDYDWIYFWTSQYVHATAVCMNTHAVRPREAFKVLIAAERDTQTAGLAVFNSGIYIWKILVMAFRALGQDFPEKLSRPLWQLLTEMTKRD
jgi:hypothetical protein